jgi:hypothetical protein
MGRDLMNPEQFDASLTQVRSERELLKLLLAHWRVDATRTPDAQATGNVNRIKARLLQVKMEAHLGCTPLEHDLWLALYEEELRLSEQNGRRFEDGNFRRRIEALGIINAAIETVLHYRTRASSRLKTISLEAVLLRHREVFGDHLCDVARKNLEIRALFEQLGDEPDGE